MTLLLLQTVETVQTSTEVIKTLGFPVAVAVTLLVFMGYVFKTVWTYVTAKIDEKDILIAEQAESRKEFAEKLINTQDRLVTGQRNINETLKATNEMIGNMSCINQ